jgi:hypothetical protein
MMIEMSEASLESDRRTSLGSGTPASNLRYVIHPILKQMIREWRVLARDARQ